MTPIRAGSLKFSDAATRAAWRFALPVVTSCALFGCQNSAVVDTSSPRHAALVQMMLPRSIEIQRFLTKPARFAKDAGPADGLEIVLAANDQLGDEMKAVGTFFFELHTLRPASGDRLGDQIEAWEVTVDSPESLKRYWDRPSRWYRFPVQLRDGTLPPGSYILSARYVSPWDEKLFAEYEFTYTP